MTDLLNQRYRLIRRLGGGGMGDVYLAADTKLEDRLVAVKKMRQDQLKTREDIEAAAQSFRREALMLAALRYHHLPRIYEYFQEDGEWFLAMDFIEGQTLETYREAQGGKLPVGEVLDIGLQLCSVLSYLHTRSPQSIIFRDLKPLNIMRTPDGHLYLIDFGIARHFKLGQTHDTFLGISLGYTPPEQWPAYHKEQTTSQSDIYSLGATLHHLLTGHHPKDNEPSVFDFAPLLSFDPSLPSALNTLIMQMVKKDAKDRPISAAVVKEKLQHIAAALKPASQPKQSTLPVGTVLLTYRGHRSVSSFGGVASLAWTSDSTRIASATLDGGVHVWDASSGKRLLVYDHSALVQAVSCSPDSQHFASTHFNRAIQVWDASSGKHILTIHSSTFVNQIAWSPDGTRLASIGGCPHVIDDTGNMDDKIVQIWDTAIGNLLFTYSGHSVTVQAIAWSSDSIYIASGSADGMVHIWNAVTRSSSLIYKAHPEGVITLEWLSKDRHLASSSGNMIQIWDVVTRKNLRTLELPSSIYTMAWSPDGIRFALAPSGLAQTVQVWNTTSGYHLLTYEGHSDTVNAVVWSPDGTCVASGSDDRTVQIWKAT